MKGSSIICQRKSASGVSQAAKESNNGERNALKMKYQSSE
jgi:hypothetical protein